MAGDHVTLARWEALRSSPARGAATLPERLQDNPPAITHFLWRKSGTSAAWPRICRQRGWSAEVYALRRVPFGTASAAAFLDIAVAGSRCGTCLATNKLEEINSCSTLQGQSGFSQPWLSVPR